MAELDSGDLEGQSLASEGQSLASGGQSLTSGGQSRDSGGQSRDSLDAIHAERVAVLKALADPVRLEIVRVLYANGNREMSCMEVGELCSLTKSNHSHHHRTLKEAGLLLVRKDSQHKYNRLNVEAFERLLPGFLDTLVK
jgi:ArsR family transcriptional regulator, lead/cadmium/zinc/bismuth-responsive transcriptional repressor